MRSFDYWMVKHQRLASFIFCLLFVAIDVALFILLEQEVWLLLLTLGLSLLLVAITVNTASARISNRAVKILNDECDPEPLLENCGKMLEYSKKRDRIFFILKLNEAVARHLLGDAEQALKLIGEIDLDNISGLIPMDKVVYYNNLSAFEGELENKDAADAAFEMQSRLFSDMKDGKLKDGLVDSLNIALAAYRKRRGELSEALEAIAQVRATARSTEIQLAFMHAEIFEDMGEHEKARERYSFVAKNGGKLFLREKARKRLAAYDAPTE